MFYCQRCTRVHKKTKKDNLGRKCCPGCGWIKGDPPVPCVWTCEECGEVDIDHGTDKKPLCPECGGDTLMSVMQARPSAVNGCGIGGDYDLGYELLIDAQSADLDLGSDLLRDAQK